MADKLTNLMGLLPRRYQLTFGTVSAGTLTIPPGMASVSALSPTVGQWLSVVDVSGAGRCRGVVLSVVAPAGAPNTMRVRVTIDGSQYEGIVALGSSGNAYVYLAEMSVGADLTLLAERLFAKNFKIEVRRDNTFVPAMTLYYLYELEAA